MEDALSNPWKLRKKFHTTILDLNISRTVFMAHDLRLDSLGINPGDSCRVEDFYHRLNPPPSSSTLNRYHNAYPTHPYLFLRGSLHVKCRGYIAYRY